MLRLPPEPRRGSAALRQPLLVSPRFARLPPEAVSGSAVAVGEQDASRKFLQRQALWKAFDKTHPGARPQGNRSTHQRRAADHALRTLPRDVAMRVRLSLPPNARRKFFPQARSPLAVG